MPVFKQTVASVDHPQVWDEPTLNHTFWFTSPLEEGGDAAHHPCLR